MDFKHIDLRVGRANLLGKLLGTYALDEAPSTLNPPGALDLSTPHRLA